MPPTIIAKNAGNWVDRGEPANRKLRQVLAHFYNRHAPEDDSWLDEHANIIAGMVAADATEVHIAAYLRSVARTEHLDLPEPIHARGPAITLWHVAKAALVRDFAERVLKGEIPVNAPTRDSFSHWIAARLLDPDELARFEADAQLPDAD